VSCGIRRGPVYRGSRAAKTRSLLVYSPLGFWTDTTNPDQLKQQMISAAVKLALQASAAIDAIHQGLPNPTV
jgi:hypothetical protein